MRYFSCIVVVVCFCCGLWSEQNAEILFQQGNKYLTQGQFPQALQSFAKALKIDSANKKYRQEYLLMRRIIRIRKRLMQTDDLHKWVYMALSLHRFYSSHQIYSELLDIDYKIHTKVNNSRSAALLA